MALETIEIVNGIFSLIFVVISTIVGIIIISKFPKTKQRTFLFVGLSWIGIASPYWGSSVSLLVGLATGKGITPQLYMLIALTLLPLFFLFWMIAFTDLVFKDKQKIILIIFSIEAIIFEIFFLFYLFTNPIAIGELQSPVNMRYLSFVRIWLLIHALIFLITGLLFARKTIKLGTPEMQLKGLFIAIAFISYMLGASLDILFPLGFVINRIILMSSAVEFYFGFTLPDWIKKLLIKQK